MSYESHYYPNFSCIYCIIDPLSDQWDYQNHFHTVEELLLITSEGHCTIENNGSTYEIPTPAFIWNRAGTYHNITNVPKSTRTSYLIAFVPDLLADFPPQFQFTDFMQDRTLFALPLNGTRLNRLDALFTTLGNGPLQQRQLLLPCIFHQITLYLKAGAVPTVASNRHGYIPQVLSLLENSGGENMTSKELAARFHVNRNKLEADFKKATGQTLYAFRHQLQLQSARVLLLTTNQSLTQIAAACNFTDKSHLIRSFQKKFGMTPGAFRIQHAQKPRWYK